ncbi:MAG: tetratricopeptide repeat protein [Pirellulales bacterium]
MCGCRSWPWQSGPVPDSVSTCRDLSNQALVAIERGQWQESEGLLRQAIKTCPVDADAHRHLAEVLVNRNATNEALSHLEEARQLVPHDTSLTIRVGELYLNGGQIKQAERRAEQAIQLDRKSPDSWALRGRVRHAQGDLRAALSDLQQALHYRPDNPVLLSEISRLYIAMRRPDRALLYAQALSDTFVSGSVPIEVIDLQAQAYTALGRRKDAVVCRQQLCQTSPTAANFFALAQAELARGDAANAEAALQQALSIKPNHQPSLQLMQIARAKSHNTALR